MSPSVRMLFFPLGVAAFAHGIGCSSTSEQPRGSTSSSSSSGVTSSSGGETGGGTNGGTEKFSFFVTSLKAMQELSGSQSGFGGDLRFGETGPGAGMRGADKICATIAEKSMKGAGSKPWRAFLSAVAGEDGKQVNAIDRIGEGPWYDRLGRLVANTKAELMSERPSTADPAIINDLPNEEGLPNHQPDPSQPQVDNHDTLTGTNTEGKLYSATATCNDWTGAKGDLASEGRPRVGHSWPRLGGGGGDFPDGGFGGEGPPDGGHHHPDGGFPDGGPGGGFPDGGFPDGGFPDGGFPGGGFPGGGFPDGGFGGGGMGSMNSWMSSLDESGCAPGVNIVEMGPPNPNSTTVGSGGGYGGIYCFALTP